MSLLNNQKNFSNLVKNVAPNTSRTETNKRHKNIVSKQNFLANNDDNSDERTAIKECEKYECLQNSNFISLNAQMNFDNSLQQSKTLNKHSETHKLEKEHVLTFKGITRTIDRTPKIRSNIKAAEISKTHHPSKSMSKGRVFYHSLDVGVKVTYAAGFRHFNAREVYKPRQISIDKQKSENHNSFNRKTLLEQELAQSSPQKGHTEDNRIDSYKLDNHVTKFSFATKAGKSVKNPRKKNQDQYIVEPIF